jgi:uncharacterized phage protein (TIGR02218 family)
MSYEDSESGVHTGQPIECFEFVTTFETYRYTSYDREIVVASKTFEPLAMKRTPLRIGSSEEDSLDVQVEIPQTCKLAKDSAYVLTPPRIDLTIYRAHLGTDLDTDYVVYWKGPVASITLSANKALFRIPGQFANALAGHVPGSFYQSPCNHVLFDGGCKVIRADFMVNTTVVGVAGLVIELDDIDGRPDHFYEGGELVNLSTGERRMITTQFGPLLTVTSPFGSLVAGDNVQATAGCDHAFLGDCKNKFDNNVNFGGFPYIPPINPFTEGF